MDGAFPLGGGASVVNVNNHILPLDIDLQLQWLEYVGKVALGQGFSTAHA